MNRFFTTLVVLLIVCTANGVMSLVEFNDQFTQHSGFDPSKPTSKYFYDFFDYTTTTIVNTLYLGQLNQSVNPYTNTVPFGPLGVLDHVKALQYVKTAFKPGYKQGVLSFKMNIGCVNYGAENHPFPSEYVTNANDDLRLASCAMNIVDMDTMIVADFFLTNQGIYAFYERLPFTRTQSDYYHSFSQAKRVGDRNATDIHSLIIVYDSKHRTLSWFVGTDRVLFVSMIGYPSSDPNIVTLLDGGGQNTLVQPTSFNVGFGEFTVLDARDYWNPSADVGLVRLNDASDINYVVPGSFYDDVSLSSNRLWGQGSDLIADNLLVESF